LSVGFGGAPRRAGWIGWYYRYCLEQTFALADLNDRVWGGSRHSRDGIETS
jgi:hypothetical protein